MIGVSDVSTLGHLPRPIDPRTGLRVPKRRQVGEAWERQQGEHSRAWAAFLIYRGLGDERSIDLVRADPKITATKPTLQKWASLWDWVERSRAYDNHLDRRRVEAAAKAVEAMTERHVQTGMALQQKGLQWVQENLDTEVKRRRLTPTSALRFIELGSQMERKARKVDDEVLPGPTGVMAAGVKVDLFVRIGQMAANIEAVQALSPGGAIVEAAVAQIPPIPEESGDEEADEE